MSWDRHRTPRHGGSAPATPGFNAVAPEWLIKYGAADAAPAVPAAESTLGSHPCVALSSAQVLPEWINPNLAGNRSTANGDNPLTSCLTPGVHFTINNQGQVVGHSELVNDSTFHGFLWTRETGMRDLGTLPGDFASLALGINDRGDVVGASLDAKFSPRAVLRQKGAMADLNSLIPAGSPLFLLLALSINSSGEIVGLAFHPSTGDLHGFLAAPRNGEDGGDNNRNSAAPDAQGVTSPMVLPENVRNLLRQRLPLGRFGARLMGRDNAR